MATVKSSPLIVYLFSPNKGFMCPILTKHPQGLSFNIALWNRSDWYADQRAFRLNNSSTSALSILKVDSSTTVHYPGSIFN